MSTDVNSLEVTTRKVRNLFPEEIKYSQETGLCKIKLWVFILGLCRFLKAHIATNEGYNSLLKGLAVRCRNIGLPLLSARCNIKRSIGVGMRGSQTRWGSIKGVAAGVLQDALENFEEGQLVLATADRWKAPMASDARLGNPITEFQLYNRYNECFPSDQPADIMLKATKRGCLWHRVFQEPSALLGFVLESPERELKPGMSFFFLHRKKLFTGHSSCWHYFGKGLGSGCDDQRPLRIRPVHRAIRGSILLAAHTPTRLPNDSLLFEVVLCAGYWALWPDRHEI